MTLVSSHVLVQNSPNCVHLLSSFFWLIDIVFLFFSAIIYPWLDFGLPPHCPQVVWCHWGEIEPFSATLAQDGLAECDQPGKNPLKYSAVAGNWTRATGRTDSELFHWAIVTLLKRKSCATVIKNAKTKLCVGTWYIVPDIKDSSTLTDFSASWYDLDSSNSRVFTYSKNKLYNM